MGYNNFMKYLLIVMLIVSSCGKKTEYVPVKGDKGDVGQTGNSGSSGPAGNSGNNGSPGITSLLSMVSVSTCSNGGYTFLSGLDSNRNSVLDAGEVTSSAEVCNGLNGNDGADAPATAFTPVALLNPCGDAPGVYDEVFLKLSNGTVLASFSDNANGYNTRFTVLVPGTYITTDGDNCTFSIDSSGNFTYQSHLN